MTTRNFFIYRSIIFALAISAVGLFIFFNQEDVSHNGRSYPNKEKLCYQLAIDFLRNVREDPAYTKEKWEMAVDIETEITKLCQLELSEQAIASYEANSFDKYRNGLSLGDQIRECMPLSNWASKLKCDQLIAMINSFEDCLDAGLYVTETNPRQCRTPDNRVFVEK